jgi:hypothetical protein
MSRHAALFAALMLVSASAGAEMRSVHADLARTKAQARREEVFRHLMTGATPSWLAGKSPAVIARRTEAMRKAILANARKIVKAIVANPNEQPAAAEQNVLGLLSPAQRAQLLKEEAGFKVEKVKFKVNGTPTDKLKITLKRYATGEGTYFSTPPATPEFARQMSIYNRVMGANIVTYMPAGGHSKYTSRGGVFDMWDTFAYGGLRPNNHPLFPTWLSDGEAKRLKSIADPAGWNWSAYLGQKLSHGRPGMWPPTPGQTLATGNSCTTTFIRAPIGEREASYAWIDGLQGKIRAAANPRSGRGALEVAGVDLKGRNLLEAITGKTPAEYGPIFDAIKSKLPREAARIDKLRAEVDFFHGQLKTTSYDYSARTSTDKCVFPLDLMHRTPLAQLAKITGDPVGPGMATQKFRAADPTRLGVVTVFEKAPKRSP